MPRASISTSHSARRSGRNSGAPTTFISLDMYATGKQEHNIKSFDIFHNHNGVPLEPAASVASSIPPAAAKRRRAQSVVKKPTASLKRPKREESASEDDNDEEDEEVETSSTSTSKRSRGRPPKVATTPSSGRRAKSQAPVAAKKAPLVTVKQEMPDSDEEEEEVARPPPRSGRGRSVAPAAAPSLQQVQPQQQQAFRDALDAHVAERAATLTAAQKRDLASLLNQVCDAATNPPSHANVSHTLKVTVKHLRAGNRAREPSQFEDLEEANLKLARELRDANTEKQRAEKSMKEMAKTLTASQKEKEALRRRVDQLEKEMERRREREDRNDAAATGSASSSSSHTGPSSSRGHSSNNNHHLDMMPQAPSHFALSVGVGSLPRGSAVGHSMMQGRADEIIQGLNNVSGMENSMASVAVTAATMPVQDENGDLVQRTVRTRVERIAVTDDMDLAQLRAMGFEVVAAEDDEEELEPAEGRARIREMGDDEDEEEEMVDDGGYENDGDEPYVEEAE